MTRRERFRSLIEGVPANFRVRELWEIFNEQEKEIEGLQAYHRNVEDAVREVGYYKP